TRQYYFAKRSHNLSHSNRLGCVYPKLVSLYGALVGDSFNRVVSRNDTLVCTLLLQDAFQWCAVINPAKIWQCHIVSEPTLHLKGIALHNIVSIWGATYLSEMGQLHEQSIHEPLDICYASTGAICNLGEYMHFFAMDTIFNITFGRDLDFINSGDPKGFCRQLQDGLGYLVSIGQIPWAHRFLLGNRIVAGLLNRLTDEESVFDKVMSLATSYRTIAEKEALIGDDEATSCTFLSRLLRNPTRNPSLITDREINMHIFGNITAGGDTTSTALRAILRDLIRHPAVIHRLLAELRDAGLGNTEAPVPYGVASKLPYLSAIIRESMRLQPSVGMMLARGVPPEGAVFRDGDRNEYHIGPGVEVGINPWVVPRNPQVFPNPEVYSPERWLEAAPGQLAQMKRAWMPFGAGRHTCSGQHISMLEITKLVPTIVLRYVITWSSPSEDVSVFNRFFTIQKGLLIRLENKSQ
ncbi:pisatin demethylase cytochrome P450, partial [Colletotrichum asianum]